MFCLNIFKSAFGLKLACECRLKYSVISLKTLSTIEALRAAMVQVFRTLNMSHQHEINRACHQGVEHRAALCGEIDGNHVEQFRQGHN